MAQSPNTMQEPSMDELLASIREIIEENAGAAPDDGANKKVESDTRSVARQPAEANTTSYRAEPRSAPQQNNAPAPMQDAMNALAERIGLRNKNASAPAPVPAMASAGAPAAVAEPEAPSKPAPAQPTVKVPFLKEPKVEPIPAPVQQPMQVQPQPQVQATPQPVQPQVPVQSQPQVQSQPPMQVQPQAQQPFQVQPQLQASFRPQVPQAKAKRLEQKASEIKIPIDFQAEVKKEMDEMEKTFRADFEKSAELLLRPYIAQWLDEHFRNLFDKVLREEIQRLVQNLRR